MSRSVVVVLLALLLPVLFATPSLAARAILLIRHAEKAPDPGDDPELSIPGEDRAIALTRYLRHMKIDAVFVTQYRRTQQTAAILARQRELAPVVVKAEETKALVAKIRALPSDAVVLVVGHSNTIPEIIAALGAREKVSIRDDEYGRVFVVTPSEDAAVPSLLQLMY